MDDTSFLVRPFCRCLEENPAISVGFQWMTLVFLVRPFCRCLEENPAISVGF